MKLRILFLIGLICCPIYGQEIVGELAQGARIDKSEATIHIKYVCEKNDAAYLRFSNNSPWHISVESALNISPKYQIRLRNGVKTYGVPNDMVIDSLFYKLDFANVQSDVSIPESVRFGVGSIGGGTWVGSGRSIIFPVPKKYFESGLRVAVPFRYEWEITADGYDVNEPEHRVFFDGNSLKKQTSHCPTEELNAKSSDDWKRILRIFVWYTRHRKWTVVSHLQRPYHDENIT